MCGHTIVPARVRIFRLDITGSTNDDAFRMLAQGHGPELAVIARAQRAGRGRGSKAWLSPEGGVWLSVAAVCNAPAGVVSLGAALAAALAIEDAVQGADIGIKWPNDLMMGGRKIGGVLGERRFVRPGDAAPALVVGVGINADNTRGSIGDLPHATTLRDELGRRIDPDALGTAIADALVAQLSRLDGADRLAEDVRAAIDARLAQRGSWIGSDSSQRGRLVGVDHDGAALLDAGDGAERVVMGDLGSTDDPARRG